MVENVQLLFSILGLIAFIFLVLELALDIDTVAGRFVSKIKKSNAKSKNREED